jgi:hypothetical protein
MRERDEVGPGFVTRLQKPTAQSLGHLVQRIASRRLLNLTELKLGISDDKRAQPGAEVHDGLKSRCRNAQAGTGHLHQRADKRAARSQSHRHADRSFGADGPDFNGGVLGHLHNERDHSTLRKINGIRGRPGSSSRSPCRVRISLRWGARCYPAAPAAKREAEEDWGRK